METGTTSRWAALLLFAGLIGAAFAINGFQAKLENAAGQSPGAMFASTETRGNSELPTVRSLAGLR